MPPQDQTAVLVNSVLNFLTLVLTAWILRKQSATADEVKTNTRVSRRTRRTVRVVRRQTDGALTALQKQLTDALELLAKRTGAKPQSAKPTSAKPRKPSGGSR